MFGSKSRASSGAGRISEVEGVLAAMEACQAVLELTLDATVIRANRTFLDILGYSASEIAGRNHTMFLSAKDAAADGYRQAWAALNRGEVVQGKFRRLGKGGKELWLRCAYSPILDERGKPVKVIVLATDVSDSERERAEREAERLATTREQDEVVSALADGLQRLSAGDLTVEITAQFTGPYARIRADFNSAASSLCGAMASVTRATHAIRGNSQEIAQASDNLSRRTEQTAASLEETVAALDQITATVKRSAQGAREASDVASGARNEAASSGDVVREAVAAMHDIQESSGKIGQIIGVIDEIAFQTNLLALNAGVEAARAGEAGRGFAVVASEVRALAQRSAEAAKEIKTLISASSQQVEHGVKLVGATGEALTAIVGRVTQIDGLISEIAQSAQEQATGLGEVNTAVNQMDNVTQQNAAMVEEATAAANQLKHEADELNELMGTFSVGHAASARTAARPAPRPTADAPALQRRLRTAVGGGGAAAAAASEWSEF